MDRTEILNDYVTDMAAVEQHILTAVEHQLSSDATAKYPDVVRVLNTLQTTLQRHVKSLEAFNDKTEGGGLKETVKEALTSALGVAAGIYDKLRNTDKVSRMVRDTYTATSLAAVSYHMLYTTALGLKAADLAGLALRNLRELTPILVDLSKVVCSVVVSELNVEDKIVDASVTDEAIRATQEAWSAENVEG